jgi:hypothetical protein
MKMRKMLPLILLGTALLATPAFACKCATLPRDNVIAATPVVFDGEVLRVELDEDGQREVTVFRVHGAVKGIPFRANARFDAIMRRRVERTVTIVSNVRDAECGWDFRAGPQRLTVGAKRDGSDLVATRCIIYNLNRTILPQ